MTDSNESGQRAAHRSIAPTIFYPALAVVGGVAGLTIAFPGQANDALMSAQESVVAVFGWYYALLVAFFVGFAIWMGVSRFGDIVLGDDDDEAAFSLPAWFGMLFAAGMGIGLIFWGAAEPLSFFVEPKPGESGSDAELAKTAMAQAYVHWGVHAWAIYVVVGLALAYAIHRKGRPVSIRWALEPLLGSRVDGKIGDAIDVVAVVGTLFGVATSLGLGVQQIAAGLVHLDVFDSVGDPLLVGIIVVITLAATLSVVSGLDRGIKWLSNLNLAGTGLFMLTVLILGPTLFLLRDHVENMGEYFQSVVAMTFDAAAFTGEEGQAWQAEWSTFYWGWWISWAPFVGVFIARISRDRTVREFVAGVLLVPTAVTFLWFSVLGGSALYQMMFGEGGLTEEDGSVVPENVLFNLLSDLPAGGLLSVIVIGLIAVFFVTSSDSGSLVVDMLTSGGNPDPPTWSRVLWSVMEGLLAIALLLAGGLAALRTGATLTALPFSLVMLAMCLSIYLALKGEHRVNQKLERLRRRRELTEQVGQDVSRDLTRRFENRIDDKVDEKIEEQLEQEVEQQLDAVLTEDGAGSSASATPERRWRRPRQRHQRGSRPSDE